ncbi:MAG: hypothetical protein PHO62_07895 [Sulfurimonas sp.]|uniref:hypothetical protein n=1 Tax=Sulfurimonas sp. TaxID=2022749 RepID=UPI002622145A|nr:hypothetical protein [Sulfurimonas sp.]MDD5373329.1 hypothetical protein [Sulfurimonas sp.]
MIVSYIKNGVRNATLGGVAAMVALGGYYFFKISSIEESSPLLALIKNEKSAIEALRLQKGELEAKIEKLSALDKETTQLVALQKKYEMNPQKTSADLTEIFNMLSNEYGLFSVTVVDVAPDGDFLNLLNVRLVVNAADVAALDEASRAGYMRKMRELVVLYLYKNRELFSIHGDIGKSGNDGLSFKIIKRG